MCIAAGTTLLRLLRGLVNACRPLSPSALDVSLRKANMGPEAGRSSGTKRGSTSPMRRLGIRCAAAKSSLCARQMFNWSMILAASCAILIPLQSACCLHLSYAQDGHKVCSCKVHSMCTSDGQMCMLLAVAGQS